MERACSDGSSLGVAQPLHGRPGKSAALLRKLQQREGSESMVLGCKHDHNSNENAKLLIPDAKRKHLCLTLKYSFYMVQGNQCAYGQNWCMATDPITKRFVTSKLRNYGTAAARLRRTRGEEGVSHRMGGSSTRRVGKVCTRKDNLWLSNRLSISGKQACRLLTVRLVKLGTLNPGVSASKPFPTCETHRPQQVDFSNPQQHQRESQTMFHAKLILM